ARLRHVDRLDDEERGDVLDLSLRIALGERQVGDLGVLEVVRVELAEGAPGDRLVLPGAAEARARLVGWGTGAERRRYLQVDNHPGDAGFGLHGDSERGRDRSSREREAVWHGVHFFSLSQWISQSSWSS